MSNSEGSDFFIHTVDSSSFSVGGTEYPVSYAQLSMGVNEIPSVTVGIGVATKESPFISKLSMKNLADTLAALNNAVVSRSEATLAINLSSSGGEEENLWVAGWVVTGVGLTQVNPKAPFSLECTITHPAYALATTHAFARFSDADPLSHVSFDGVKDLVSAAKSALSALKAANSAKQLPHLCSTSVALPTAIKGESEVWAALSSGLDEAISAISSYLEWDSSEPSFPGGSVATGDVEIDNGVKYAMVAAWLEGFGGGSVFSILQNVIGTNFLTEVIPSYHQFIIEDKLKLRPAISRKSSPDFTLGTSSIAHIDFPSLDREPLFGEYMYLQNTYTTSKAITFSYSAAEKLESKSEMLAYVPSASNSRGVLNRVTDPPWISFAGRMGQAYPIPPAENEDAKPTFSEPKVRSLPVSQDSSYVSGWNDLRLKYLAHTFQIHYRSAVTATLQLPFMPSLGLSPGKFLSVKDDGAEGGGSADLFRGKISRVLHSINCASSSALTVVDLQYCEIGDGSSDAEVVGDRRPALYT